MLKRTLLALVTSATLMGSIAYANVHPTSTTLPAHTKLTYSIEGTTQSVNANLFQSSQGYFMYTIRGFKASREEPGKDIVLSERNKADFMRIEKLPANVNLANLRVNTKVMLKNVGSPQLVGSTDPFFKKAVFEYHAANKSASQTAIVLKVDGSYYRFLVNVHANTESVSPYFAMIKSIKTLKDTSSVGTVTGTTGGAGTGNGAGTGTDKGSGAGGGVDIGAGQLTPSIIDEGSNASGTHQFRLELTNQTETEQDVFFASGQQFDYILYQNGQEIGRYSRGKMFSMHTETDQLNQGASLSFPISLDGLTPGQYQLTAWVTCSPVTQKVNVTFDVK